MNQQVGEKNTGEKGTTEKPAVNRIALQKISVLLEVSPKASVASDEKGKIAVKDKEGETVCTVDTNPNGGEGLHSVKPKKNFRTLVPVAVIFFVAGVVIRDLHTFLTYNPNPKNPTNEEQSTNDSNFGLFVRDVENQFDMGMNKLGKKIDGSSEAQKWYLKEIKKTLSKILRKQEDASKKLAAMQAAKEESNTSSEKKKKEKNKKKDKKKETKKKRLGLF